MNPKSQIWCLQQQQPQRTNDTAGPRGAAADTPGMDGQKENSAQAANSMQAEDAALAGGLHDLCGLQHCDDIVAFNQHHTELKQSLSPVCNTSVCKWLVPISES